MPRRKEHAPLNVLINNRLCGRLKKEAGGAILFQYDQSWLDWPPAFPISLSLPLRPSPWRGEAVVAVFDNLLPDNPHVRRQVAERTGAGGIDAYSLLEQIGRDCVGAMQFIPEGEAADALQPVRGVAISDGEIEAMLANLARAPLGIDVEHEFRISIAGAQEKTALLRHQGRWMRPIGTTPTTHILKPQLGEIPTPWGMIDLSDSVENEHYCLTLLASFGLPIAGTEIVRFGGRRVLVVERFDRRWRGENQLLRLPQEDFCQALSVPSKVKGPALVGRMWLREKRNFGAAKAPVAVARRRKIKNINIPSDVARTEPALRALKTLSILVQATASSAAAAPKFLRPTNAIGRRDGQPFILPSCPPMQRTARPTNSGLPGWGFPTRRSWRP